ncbi:amsh [Anopheles darlingi]|uniref:Amsh n=1 Tax=Anopheles darlingi TaxID=43151 RepID=W5JIT6_ANODA|nr:amsh [Anopheles darlingi]
MAQKQAQSVVPLSAIEPHQRIQKLVADSQRVSIDPTMPINRYYRSGSQIVETADRSLREGKLEKAFTFYLRFVTIFVELILQHPGYRSVLPQDKQQTKAKIKEIMPKAEVIRKKLLAMYTAEYERYLVQAQQTAREAKEAEREEQERAAQEKALDHSASVAANVSPAPSAPSYISVISEQDVKMMDQVFYPSEFLTDRTRISGQSGGGGLLLPDANRKVDRSLKPSSPSVPSVSTVPSAQTAAITSATGFRAITVPSNTMRKFLAVAAANTQANLETCAILAGTLRQSAFYITHVIFPKQTGTADSCNTMNEEEIADVQDRHNLITLGWIHTHPSQTAFLSSVDLHTHCSYQLMLEEAIAIVCSPKHQETGFFNLTPVGMDSISQCRQTGFHPHSSASPLFAEAQHIILSDAFAVDTIDLR